jgi:glycosyltransferase involved in cell wall biosynthesis
MSKTTKLPVSVLILAPSLDKLTAYQQKQLDRAVNSAYFAAEVKVIYHRQPISDFAAARNRALKQAAYEWVFFLDSDEWFGAESHEAIAGLLSNQHVSGIVIRRIDMFHDRALKYGETGKHYLLRFMRKDHSYFIRPVHELAMVHGIVTRSELIIWHESHQSIGHFWQSICRYSELEATWRANQDMQVSKIKIIWQLCTYPVGKFIYNYLWRLGILDGWAGVVYATMMSFHSLLVRIFWLEKIIVVTKK